MHGVNFPEEEIWEIHVLAAVAGLAEDQTLTLEMILNAGHSVPALVTVQETAEVQEEEEEDGKEILIMAEEEELCPLLRDGESKIFVTNKDFKNFT